MNAIPASNASNAAKHRLADGPWLVARLLALVLCVVSFHGAAQEPTTPATTSPPPTTPTPTTPTPTTPEQTTPEQASPEQARADPITAVWKQRRLSFTYSSATTIYSCSALKGRVANILRAVGARDDMYVSVNDCREGMVPPDPNMDERGGWQTSSRPATDQYLNPSTDRQLVHVSARVMMPVEVTPAVLEELKKDKSRRELVSHVTGDPAAKFNDPVAFVAQWEPVILSHKTIGLEPEECELIDQMTPTIFRQLDLRVVRKNASCDRHSVSKIAPELIVEALVVTPMGNARAPRPPSEVEKDDADPGAPPPASDDKSATPAGEKTP